MALLAKVGERLYEFPDRATLTGARELYAHHVGNQNQLEELFERFNIEFTLEQS